MGTDPLVTDQGGGKISTRTKILWGLVYALACALVMIFCKVRDHAAEQIWPEPEKDKE